MRIAVALSGGVDSAVAAYTLKQQGHDVVGLTMLLSLSSAGSDHLETTTAAASRVAAVLDIEHTVLDATERFRELVIAPFLREYASGRTPNPCIVCNEAVKFGLLMDEADGLGAGLMATGHHARVVTGDDGARLLRGRDGAKDQSYFLYRLSQKQLARSLMPIGEMTKDEVRAIATDLGVTAFSGRESADMCFAGAGLPAFIRSEAPELLRPGPIEDLDGRTLGEHDGVALYTVGQRSGLGVAVGIPVYVIRIDVARRAVIVGDGSQLMSGALEAHDLAWPSGGPPAHEFEAVARVRYAARPARCRVTVEHHSARVRFTEEQRAIAPGQSVVFYDGDHVLGGGIIEHAAGMREER